MQNDQANKIIDRFGGTYAMASICGVKPPSVCYWRKSGIPHARLMYLRAAFPDKFVEENTVVISPDYPVIVDSSLPIQDATS